MRIQIIDSSTKKPLMNTKVQLQVKGKDSGFLTLMTDGTGNLALDEKYKGQQIMSPAGGNQGPWITAAEGASVTVNNSKQKSTEDSHGSHSSHN